MISCVRVDLEGTSSTAEGEQMDNVRVGMVGSGYMGRTYAHCIAEFNEGADLVAVTLGSRAPKLAADFGVDHIPEYSEMLARDDIDAVVLATPHHLHAEETIAAAEHGKHVLVEKPMMTNVADCDAMIAACHEAGVTLSVIQTLRFRGIFKRAREVIERGDIGQVRAINMTTLWTLVEDTNKDAKPWSQEVDSGGMILDRGAHTFDMIRFLTGDEPVRMFATTNSYTKPAWNVMNAMAQVHFSRGATAQVWMAHELPQPGFPNSSDMVRVWGERGLLEGDHFGVLRVATGGEWRDVWEMPKFDFIGNPFEPVRLEAFYSQTQDFVDSLREGRPPAVTGEDGRAAIEMVEAAHLSNMTGGAVELPLPRSKGGFQFDAATVSRDKIPG